MADTGQKMSRAQLTAMVVGDMAGAAFVVASADISLFHFLIHRGVKQAAFINTIVTFANVIRSWWSSSFWNIARCCRVLALESSLFSDGYTGTPSGAETGREAISRRTRATCPRIQRNTPVFANHAAGRMISLPLAVTLCALCVTAAGGLLAGCRKGEEAPVTEVRPVRVVRIEKQEAGATIALTGRLQAQAEINQSFRIDGRMTSRNVDVGDRVRAGQVLARLDRMNEESSLQSARAQLAAAQAQALEARTMFTRMRDLLAEHAVSRASFEQSEAMAKITQSQVDSAQSLVSIAQNRLSYTDLVSDVAGVVTARGAEPGEVVPAGRMIVQIAREGAVDAVFDVPAAIKDVAPASPDIVIALASNPEVTAVGKVREVSPRADPVTGTFAVRVQVLDPPAAMRLGSTVIGHMKLPRAAAIEIPSSALIQPGGKPAVWVVDTKAGTVSVREVELQAYGEDRVEVSQGLNTGDVVVTAGVQALRPGQKINWTEAAR
ncbi:efflux RND transporter periplasmic adaptor subunit [Paraburkholderia unamae]|uniref:Efflux RND transporter periplasmic adaptor subunit n=1 Tax=Paraburkholderia unamae TaxID=219649 RepID=A0ACC6RR58_9BURK